MNKKEKMELKNILNIYFQEMVIELNLRLLLETENNICIEEPLLWIDRILLSGVEYPAR